MRTTRTGRRRLEQAFIMGPLSDFRGSANTDTRTANPDKWPDNRAGGTNRPCQ